MRQIFTIVLLLFYSSLYAQKYNYQGIIYSSGNDTIGLSNATIQVLDHNISTRSQIDGHFSFKTDLAEGKLKVAFLGFKTREVPFSSKVDSPIIVYLDPDNNSLDEVQVIGYGTTTKRYSTGSVSSISAKDIGQQPVTNVLSAMSGRMPGVFVQTTNGLPGGNINIQIRGTGSIAAGTQPLYIIDGVPYSSNFGTLNSSSVLVTAAINGIVSPLNSLSPEDIEKIIVLKDADATSIYGSRGSNGVVLITTKKGKVGKAIFDVNISSAINEVANYPKLLDPNDYFIIREEAFRNDGVEPSSEPSSPYYAPELTIWDRNKVTDWSKFYLGGTGIVNNIQTSISGGSENISFVLRGNYRREKTYLPGDNNYGRGGISANFQYRSRDQKFTISYSTIVSLDNNRLMNSAQNLALSLLLPPNYPIYDPNGDFNWFWSNPVAEANQYSKSKTENLINNLGIHYVINDNFKISLNNGYTRNSLKQRQVFPQMSLYPGTVNYSQFGNNGNETFIIEPQLNYNRDIGGGSFQLMLGGTYQTSDKVGEYILAKDFLNSTLMENLGSASNYEISNSFLKYKYASFFGRVTYDLNRKYLVNTSYRRDASSRFGPNNRVGTFGSVGIGWLFMEENFLKNNLRFVSYGKLRASIGSTGNDQISDYEYLSSYKSSGSIYEGISTLVPKRAANKDYKWESSIKREIAIELGFFHNNLNVNANYFYNNSSNQLISYAIPSLTGFKSYQANLPANVVNKGFELEINGNIIRGAKFIWKATANITIPKNILKEFENIEGSSYSKTLRIGEDIKRIYGYQFVRLDGGGQPLYRTFQGEETNNPSSVNDAFFTLSQGYPKFYGGIGNTFSYRNLTLDIFGQFAKQVSQGGIGFYTTGSFLNGYSVMRDRWTGENSESNIPRASVNSDFYYGSSSANIFDSSYFRFKNIALSYGFSSNILKKLQLRDFKIFLQAQNVFTVWNGDSAILDPESGAVGSARVSLPPTKTFMLGAQFTF